MAARVLQAVKLVLIGMRGGGGGGQFDCRLNYCKGGVSEDLVEVIAQRILGSRR